MIEVSEEDLREVHEIAGYLYEIIRGSIQPAPRNVELCGMGATRQIIEIVEKYLPDLKGGDKR